MDPAIILAATPIDPPVDGKIWAFHLVNASPDAIDSLVLEHVDYEWGDMGGGSAPNLRFGPIAPGAAIEVWRDDDDAAEVRTDLRLLLCTSSGMRRITVEFGKLYRKKPVTPVPILGRDAVVGTILEHPRDARGIPG